MRALFEGMLMGLYLTGLVAYVGMTIFFAVCLIKNPKKGGLCARLDRGLDWLTGGRVSS